MEPKDRYRQRFLDSFPAAKAFERSVRSDGSPEPLFFFWQLEGERDLRGCWLVLARLGPGLERRFGLAGEVLLLFTPYRDLQRRTYEWLGSRARTLLADYQKTEFGHVRFRPDPNVAFMWSPDPTNLDRVQEWNAEGSTVPVVVIPEMEGQEEENLETLVRAMGLVLSKRDLYRGRNPVTGNDFFGRQEMLTRVEAELRANRSLGLFGLRRSGKTSVLREFQRRLEERGGIVVLSDLEGVERAQDLPTQVGADLTDALRRRAAMDGRSTVWIGSEREQEVGSFSELASRLSRAASRNSELLLVVAVDEVENLARLARADPEMVRHFLGALRKASQGADNLPLFITGVSVEFFTNAKLPGSDIDNPLFGFVEPLFLKPFTPHESANLVSGLGKKMLLAWDDESLGRVHELAGGFPFFVRSLASEVKRLVDGTSSGSFERTVTLDKVEAARARFEASATKTWEQIKVSLRSYQPIMEAMVASPDDATLSEWLEAGPEADEAARALEELGLIERLSDETLARSRTLQTLASFGTQQATFDEVMSRVTQRREIHDLIKREEDESLEFKETARVNVHTGERDSDLELSVVKTIAGFMNLEGGTLLVGVSDTQEVVGLSRDAALCRGSYDALLNWFMSNLLMVALPEALVAECVRAEFVAIGRERVLRVDVVPSGTVVWVTWKGEDRLFVRTANSTRELSGKQIAEFAARRKGA